MIEMALTCAGHLLAALLSGLWQLLWMFLAFVGSLFLPLLIPLAQTICPWIASSATWAAVDRVMKPFNTWLVTNIVNPVIEFLSPCLKSIRNIVYWAFDVEAPADDASTELETANTEPTDEDLLVEKVANRVVTMLDARPPVTFTQINREQDNLEPRGAFRHGKCHLRRPSLDF